MEDSNIDAAKRALDQKDYELKLKRHEINLKRWEAHERYTADARAWFASLIKSILLVAGGALTLSAGIFLRKDAPNIAPEVIPFLVTTWITLGASLITSILLIVISVVIANAHAARWSRNLRTDERLKQPGPVAMGTLWVCSVIAVVCFFAGMGCLIYVAAHMLVPTA